MGVPFEEEGLVRTNNGLQDVPCTEFSMVPLSNLTAGLDEPNEPSKEELVNLRRIGSKVQAAAWLVALFSGAERFAFYALQAPLRELPRALTISALTDSYP